MATSAFWGRRSRCSAKPALRRSSRCLKRPSAAAAVSSACSLEGAQRRKKAPKIADAIRLGLASEEKGVNGGADVRKALKADSGPAGRQAACGPLSKALLDEEFVDRHLTTEQCRPRKVLYEDPEFGFCICSHVYEGAANGPPHDHGSIWAIMALP
jgi:hypothetical protein